MSTSRTRMRIAAIGRLFVWLAAVCILLVATLVATAARAFWAVDLLTFAWPYFVASAVVVLIMAVCIRQAGSILFSAMGLCIAVIPLFGIPAAPSASNGTGLKVITANLFVENQHTPAEFIEFLRRENPDIVVLQEILGHWQTEIAQSGLFAYESSTDILSRDRMKVFSRLPILSEVPLVPYFQDERIHKRPVRFVLNNSGRPLVLYAIHPETPRRPWRWRDRNNYLALTAQAAGSDRRSADVLVAGDWNTPPWSPFFGDFLRRSGLESAVGGALGAITMTRFSLRFDRLTGLHIGAPIENVAVSPGIAVRGWHVGPEYGSNHLPVVVDLSFSQ